MRRAEREEWQVVRKGWMGLAGRRNQATPHRRRKEDRKWGVRGTRRDRKMCLKKDNVCHFYAITKVLISEWKAQRAQCCLSRNSRSSSWIATHFLPISLFSASLTLDTSPTCLTTGAKVAIFMTIPLPSSCLCSLAPPPPHWQSQPLRRVYGHVTLPCIWAVCCVCSHCVGLSPSVGTSSHVYIW